MLATLRMIQVCDSLFPIGAFTLSNGLETLIANRTITDSATLEEYVSCFLDVLPYNDLGVMALSYEHASDKIFIQELDQFSMALKAPEEIRTGAKKLCSRFLKISQEFSSPEIQFSSLDFYRDSILKEKNCTGNHAIAVGLFAHDVGISKEEGASIYSYSLLNAMVTNGVKMIPLSQMVGQRILNQSQKKIMEAVGKASSINIEDLGIGGTAMDIAGMQHEELYSRLYMS